MVRPPRTEMRLPRLQKFSLLRAVQGQAPRQVVQVHRQVAHRRLRVAPRLRVGRVHLRVIPRPQGVSVRPLRLPAAPDRVRHRQNLFRLALLHVRKMIVTARPVIARVASDHRLKRLSIHSSLTAEKPILGADAQSIPSQEFRCVRREGA